MVQSLETSRHEVNICSRLSPAMGISPHRVSAEIAPAQNVVHQPHPAGDPRVGPPSLPPDQTAVTSQAEAEEAEEDTIRGDIPGRLGCWCRRVRPGRDWRTPLSEACRRRRRCRRRCRCWSGAGVTALLGPPSRPDLDRGPRRPQPAGTGRPRSRVHSAGRVLG